MFNNITDTTDGAGWENRVMISAGCSSFFTPCTTSYVAKIQNKNAFSSLGEYMWLQITSCF